MRVLQCAVPYDFVKNSPGPLQSLAVMGAAAGLLHPLVDDGGMRRRVVSKVTKLEYGGGESSFIISRMGRYGVQREGQNAQSQGLLLVAKDATTLLRGLRELAKTDGRSERISTIDGSGLAMYAGRWEDGIHANLALSALRITGHNAKQAAIRVFLATLAKVHKAVSQDTIGYLLRHVQLQQLGIKIGLDHYASWGSLANYLGRDNRLFGKCAVLYICPSQAMPTHRDFGSGTVEPQMQSELCLDDIVSKAAVLFHK